MSYTRYVTSILFVCFVAGFYFVCNVVHADEPKLYFYPELKWSVKRLNPDNDAPPVCSISNQLNNGYTVEMSGNSAAFDTLKIDFSQNVFQKGLKYEVQYLVPGASRLIVASKAEKPSMITSNLTQYPTFAEELSNVGVMDIQIRNNRFRLYLTGLKAKMAAYNKCVSGAQVSDAHPQQDQIKEKYTPSQSASASIAPPPPAISNEEKTAYTKQNEPSYIENLAKKLSRGNQNYEATSLVRTNNKGQMESKIRKSHVQSPAPVYTITKNKEPIVLDLTKSNADSMLTNISNYKTVVKSKSVKTVTEKVAQIKPASGTVSGQSSNNNFVDMRNKISSLEQKIKSLTDKNEILNDELMTTLQDGEKERLSVSSDNWNLERATMRYNEAERQTQRLGRQLQTQQAQCNLEKSELEEMLFDPKLTSQQQLTKLSSLEKKLDQAKANIYNQKLQYEARIMALKQKLGAR
ncbi:MAG: hypothetical protein KAJ40_07525 [Alphaproteobacteria bacterium]|nr:hypothetical protein [Alphaproteobacteria bacterium]